jgi:hypothetical protein
MIFREHSNSKKRESMKKNFTLNWLFGATPVAVRYGPGQTGGNNLGQIKWEGLLAASNGEKETIRVKRRRRGREAR